MTATGIYHKFNGRKARVMEAFVRNGIENAMTTRQIADNTGIDIWTIREGMRHYMSFRHKIFKRLPSKAKTKTGRKPYRYKITDYGVACYLKYHKRIKLGVDLNLHKTKPVKMNHYNFHAVNMKEAIKEGITDFEIVNYIGVTKQGATELRLFEDDEALIKAAGLLK
jgi:hypothetical protein